MIVQESEKELDVPIDEVWDWVKKLENIVSLIPRVKIVEMRDERKAKVQGLLFRFLNPPEEITMGEAETVEVNEKEKYTRSITEGKIFKIETCLKCEKMGESKTKIEMSLRGELKGLAGTLLEKILFFPFISDAVLSARIEEILDKLGNRLEKYMRKKWKNKLENKIKKLDKDYSPEKIEEI